MTIARDHAINLWRETMLKPPAQYSDRPASFDGEVEAFFVLPLPLCRPRNRLDSQKKWQLAKLKSDIWAHMVSQYPKRRSEPLPGRPQVLCCRFSSKAPDRGADWAKFPIEKLLAIRELRADRLSRQVAEFRRMAGFSRAQDVPHVPTKEALVQCLLPVVEEFFELLEACGFICEAAKKLHSAAAKSLDIACVSLPELADAMADLDYTVEGLRQVCGIDGAPIARAVHAANLLKRGGRIDENGKLRKPDGWSPPDIAEELRKQGWVAG